MVFRLPENKFVTVSNSRFPIKYLKYYMVLLNKPKLFLLGRDDGN